MDRYKALKDMFSGEQPLENPYTKEKKPKSALESGVRGAAQSASLGFADELAGALGAGGQVLKGETSFKNIPEAYKAERDDSRAQYKQAEQDNPNAYLAGEVAGGAASMAIPGIGVLRGAKAGALAGGLAGIGMSEDNVLKDAATGAALGGAVGGIASKIAPKFQNLRQKMNLTPEEAFRKEINPELFKFQTQGKASKGLEKFSRAVDEEGIAAQKADEILLKKEAVDAGFDNIDDYLNDRRQKLKNILELYPTDNSYTPVDPSKFQEITKLLNAS